jgi:hypothetical protein
VLLKQRRWVVSEPVAKRYLRAKSLSGRYRTYIQGCYVSDTVRYCCPLLLKDQNASPLAKVSVCLLLLTYTLSVALIIKL